MENGELGRTSLFQSVSDAKSIIGSWLKHAEFEGHDVKDADIYGDFELYEGFIDKWKAFREAQGDEVSPCSLYNKCVFLCRYI